MNERIEKAISSVKPADKEVMTAAKERQAQLAKPPGSLGVLEELSIRVAGMTGKIHNKAEKCRIIVLCADNGVCDEGVSCTPQSVTLAQTINLTRGMTGASSLAKHFGDEIEIIQPGKDFTTQKVQVLKNENMEDIEVANHAAMTLYIKTDVPVVKDAMLRKKAE